MPAARGKAVNSHTRRGLAGIHVSDGDVWTITDADGGFALDTARPVWIRRPDGWRAERWWASPATQIEFELHREARQELASRDVVFAHLSDPHLSVTAGDPTQVVELASRNGDSTDRDAVLGATLAAAAQRGAGFAVITGDLTDHGTPAEFDRVAACVAAAPLPVYLLPGNHDHYGHRYESCDGDEPSGAGFLGTATTARYEAAFGPRWWSADHGGLHLLALDWFSAWCGIDGDQQHAFITADLARTPPGTRVVLLSHGQPSGDWFDHIRVVAPHVTIVGALSGHWHAPRVQDDAGCLLVSTGPACFGGLDWSRAGFRLLRWNGTALAASPQQQLVPQPAAKADPASRARGWRLGSSQHLGSLVSGACDLYAPAWDDHTVTGSVVAVHPRTGPRWRREVPGGPVTGLVCTGGSVVAVSQHGEAHCLAALDGGLRWRHRVGDHRWARLLAGPAVAADGTVVVGDLGGVAALEGESGHLRWRRDDLGPVDTLHTYGAGICTDTTVLLPFGGPYKGLTSLRLADGAVIWTDPSSTPPPNSAISPIDGGDGLVVRAGPLLERFCLRTGAVRWRTALTGGLSTSAAVRDGKDVVVVTGDGIVHRIDPTTGQVRKLHRLPALEGGYGPYRTSGTGAPTTPVGLNGRLVIVLIDGSVWALPPLPATPQLLTNVGCGTTTQPVALDTELAVLDASGHLHVLTIPLEEVPP